MSEVTEINDLAELDKAIADNETVVALFHAPAWCQPCKKFHPHFVKASESVDAKFVEIDIDIAMDIARDYGVMSVPTVKRIRKDEVTDLKARTVIPLVNEING